ETVKAAFRKAAQLWRDDTCIDIKEYEDFGPGFRTVNFLDVEDGDGCVSQVGKPNEGPQPLTLGKGCGSVWVQSTFLYYTQVIHYKILNSSLNSH
ncbi:hypothetical protein OSTOST_10734, partial [Ostertagia ostertagi]